MRLTINSQIKDLLAHKECSAVMEKHIGNLLKVPFFKNNSMFVSLIEIHSFFPEVISGSMLFEISDDLKKIEEADLITEALPREEVIKAVERKGPSRIPIVRGKWWGEGLYEQYGDRLNSLDHYPEDVVHLWINPTPFKLMGLSWELPGGSPLQNKPILDTWDKLDEFIEKLPDPGNDPQLEFLIEPAEAAREAGRYLLFGWWRLFFEKPWEIRGMQNIMMDYYTDPDNVKRLHDALLKQYCGYIKRAGKILMPDGLWTGDDLGHQNGPMMGPETFHEFIFPYYRKLSNTLKEEGMHFWLHSCGDNTKLMDDLIEGGVDVLHPVQKHCMDEVEIGEKYGGNITFLSGIDVQHTLQEKEPEEIRKEVRFLIDTFDRPDGGMCIGAGNGIMSGVPFENIDVYLDEALKYGVEHRSGWK